VKRCHDLCLRFVVQRGRLVRAGERIDFTLVTFGVSVLAQNKNPRKPVFANEIASSKTTMSQILRATFIQCLQKLGAFSPKEEVVTPQNPAPPQPSRRATATTSNKFRVEKRASKKRAGAARTLERNIKDRQRTLAELEAVIAEQRQTIIVLENKLELARHQVGRIYVERWIAILETQQIPFATERRNFVTPDNDILETKIDKLWHLILDVGAGGATRWERSRHKRLLKSPFYDHVQRTGYKDDQMVSPKIVLTAAVAFYLFQEVVLEPLYVILGRWVLRRGESSPVCWSESDSDLEYRRTG